MWMVCGGFKDGGLLKVGEQKKVSWFGRREW